MGCCTLAELVNGIFVSRETNGSFILFVGFFFLFF